MFPLEIPDSGASPETSYSQRERTALLRNAMKSVEIKGRGRNLMFSYKKQRTFCILVSILCS